MGCHFLLQCMEVKSESEAAQSCPTLSDPMGCSLPGSSVHGIFQARYWSGCHCLLQIHVQGLPKRGLGVALICFLQLFVSSPAHLAPTRPQDLRVPRARTRLTAPRISEPRDGWRFKSLPSGDPASLTAAAQMRNMRQWIHRGPPQSASPASPRGWGPQEGAAPPHPALSYSAEQTF